MLIDILSTFITITLCIAGASVSVLIKHWVIDNQRISRLEKEHIQSELEQLKDQITPDFLFKILNRTSVLVKSEPKKANEMLMKLSMILRYQLYDCDRDKVLLNSEINFIQNYLNLRHLFCDDFMFEVVIDGNVNRTFLPPLLFIPFVQDSISNISKGTINNLLQVRFEVINNTIYFWCNSTNEVSVNNPDLSNIRQRLDLLFPDKYSLNIIATGSESSMIKLELNLE
ncbi:histidine kinase [uncultured Dysgonomonas sp.]|nr:histidine kinase [uncultured Dysgonomonas sp.]